MFTNQSRFRLEAPPRNLTEPPADGACSAIARIAAVRRIALRRLRSAKKGSGLWGFETLIWCYKTTNGYRMGPQIAFSCLISGWILWFMVDITIVNGVDKPTNITGQQHPGPGTGEKSSFRVRKPPLTENPHETSGKTHPIYGSCWVLH